MISNDADLELTRQQLARAERALQAIREEVLPASPERFRLMAESYVDMIRELRAEIDVYLGLETALDLATPLTIGLEGPKVALGETGVGLVTRILDTFRRGLQTVFEATERPQPSPRAGGRRKKWIEQLCDLPLLAIDPGSVQIRLGEPDGDGLFSHEDQELLREKLQLLLHAIDWTESADAAALEAAIPDGRIRHAVLSVVRNLVPPRGGPVESIAFRSHWAGSRTAVRLRDDARERLNAELARLVEAEQYTEASGTIREVDLDERRFILRERGEGMNDLPCEYAPSDEPLVKAFLDERVVVTGSIRTSGKTQRQTMEVESIEPDSTIDEPTLTGHRSMRTA